MERDRVFGGGTQPTLVTPQRERDWGKECSAHFIHTFSPPALTLAKLNVEAREPESLWVWSMKTTLTKAENGVEEHAWRRGAGTFRTLGRHPSRQELRTVVV